MTRVLSDLDLKYIDGRTWTLIADFSVESDVAGFIEVPAGTVTDFNSIPRALWNLLPPDDFGEAAILHDEIYATGVIRGASVPRLIADQVHREFLVHRHAPAWKVHAMFWGIRAFGYWVWRRYRAAERRHSIRPVQPE